MKRFYQGGLEDNGLSYRFEHTSPAEANRFYFKPSRRNHFMVTDEDGRCLASHLPAETYLQMWERARGPRDMKYINPI